MSAADALAFFGVTNKSSECNVSSASYTAEDNVLIAIHEGPMAFWHMKLADLIGGNYDGEYLIVEEAGVTVGNSSYGSNLGFNFFTLNFDCNQWAYNSNVIYEMNNKSVLTFGTLQTASFYLAGDSGLKP